MSFTSELFKLYGTIDINGASAITQMTQAESAGRRLSGVLGGIGKQAMGVAAGFGVFSVGARAISFLRDTFIGFNADMEDVQIGFTTMMGSADEASRFTEELLNFAAKTPFEFPQLQQAAQRMQAFGFESSKVIPMMTALGDASAGLGRGQEGIQRLTLALGQMKAKGKIQAEEMLQLTEVGVNGWKYLADAMGMSTMELQKLSQKGLLPANEAIDVIVAGMEKQFPGMMKNMENTWQGVTSTIKDNARMLIAGLTQNTFAFMKGGLIQVRDYMANVMLIFKAEGWKGLWDNLVPPDLKNTLSPVIAVFGSAFNSIKQGIKDILPVLLDIGKTAGVFLSPIVVVLGLAAKAVGEFASLIANNWGKIKPILVTTLALFLSYKSVVVTMELAKKAVFAFQVTTSLFTVMAKAVRAGGLAFAAFNYVPKTLAEVRASIILTKVVALGEFAAIAAIVTAVILLAVELVRNWAEAVPAFKSIGYSIGSVFKWLGAAASLLGREIQYGIATALRATVGNVLAFARSVVGVFEPLAQALPDQFKALYDGLNGGLASAVKGMDDFKTGSAESLDEAKSNLAGAGDALGENFATMSANVKTFGSAVWNDVKSVFGNAKQTVTNAFAGMTVASDDAATAAALDWDTAANNMQDAMDKTTGAAKKGKSAAKEAKEELDRYMNTLDPFKAKLEGIDAATEANVTQLEAAGNEAGAATAKIDGLNQKLAVQAEMIASLQAKYQEYIKTKGQDAEETIKVQNALSDAIKDEAKFKAEIVDAQKKIEEYNKKLRDHQKEVQKTGDDVRSLADKYRNDLAQASADYYEKVRQAEAQLAQDTEAAWESYEQAVEDRADSLRDFAGLFDEVSRKGASGDTLLANLRGQVDAMNDWQEAMASLQGRGISDTMYEALEKMGPSAVDNVQAMANMTDAQLAEYVALWNEKEADAKEAAVSQLDETKAETEQKISEMQARTAEQLEQYRVEWEQAQTDIKNQTIDSLTEMVKAAGEKGGEFTRALINAVKTAMPEFSGLVDQLLKGEGVSVEAAPGEEPLTGSEDGKTSPATPEEVIEGNTAAQESTTETTTMVKETWGTAQTTLATTNAAIKLDIETVWGAIYETMKTITGDIKKEINTLATDAKTDIENMGIDITATFDDLVKKATDWGTNLMDNYIQAIKDKMTELEDTVVEVAAIVSDNLGTYSPAKKGPLSKSDKWAPNLMNMYAGGIRDNAAEVLNAIKGTVFNVGLLSQAMLAPMSVKLAVSTPVGSVGASRTMEGISAGNTAYIDVTVNSGTEAVDEITRTLRLRGWRGL